jgi:transcriptional regulator with XRE-family HTH domain
MPDDTNDVADVIRTALARLGWSQARLSKESGVDPNTISDLLNRSRTPRPETVERLYKALELDDAGTACSGSPARRSDLHRGRPRHRDRV